MKSVTNKAIASAIKFNNNDKLAKLQGAEISVGVAVNSIANTIESMLDYFYDVRLVERMLTDFFKNDTKKIEAWIQTNNPHFGGSRPIDLIVGGRTKKVIQFITASKDGY